MTQCFFSDKPCFVFRFISQPREKMAGIDNKYLLEIMRKLKPLEVGQLKYILEGTFTGKIH